jgi:hypothetical protein
LFGLLDSLLADVSPERDELVQTPTKSLCHQIFVEARFELGIGHNVLRCLRSRVGELVRPSIERLANASRRCEPAGSLELRGLHAIGDERRRDPCARTSTPHATRSELLSGIGAGVVACVAPLHLGTVPVYRCVLAVTRSFGARRVAAVEDRSLDRLERG